MKFAAACTLSLVASASAFAPAPVASRNSALQLSKDDLANAGKVAMAGAAALSIMAQPAQALTKSQINELTYLQVKGTGLANRCPEVVGDDTITPKSGQKLVDMCIEPKAWAVEEEIGKGGKTEKKFVNSKVMTRQTYTLDGVEGNLSIEGGNIVFKEKEGIDYAATTIQLPGGERVPFLFTVKDLVAKGNGAAFTPGFQMGGDFALPGLQSGEEGDDELFKENNKTFDVTTGRIEMEVNKVNAEESEIGGVFVATQLGDTDMGSKVPKKILTKGIFYARVD